MRVIFMGSPDFSVPVLEALVEAGHEIAAVYCQPPRPAGRGKKDRPTAVHARAVKMGLEVRHPVSLKGDAEREDFAALGADVAVVVAYGLILPQAILDAPELGCLNIHASLLPRWRGAAPIHRAILEGDAETGVCIMQMEAGLDTGPVLLTESLRIGDEETTGALHDRLSEMGARMICKALGQLGNLSPQVQPEDGVTYAAKIDKSEAAVDWSKPAEVISRQIRGLSPFPGVWTLQDGQRIKLLGARLTTGQGNPGEALDDAMTIACGQGAVQITRAQRAGKGAQDTDVFLRGNPVAKGTVLGS
ncbi:methionyl-tRNA formyltransferase [Pelagimonas varians]|uniref:Methionyl-tRNA formyltransferase n=1 Tax=Pelagimonas varians TaxID=696760 RepID=A0A238K6M9_9RHOB|nr:methionyl-tRNA formyltransferase [Pelagimonas varians]PYG30391.1 methionyl-tRNA formyltransferase [Pelagimonas varians]SMX37762.1 Methionyl-tRNA formyltransferase [Pelagimonas varians]